MTNMVHPEISKILDGQLRPEPLYRTRRGRGRLATRGVTTSSSALADTLEGEEPTPAGEGGEGQGQHGEVSPVTVLLTITVYVCMVITYSRVWINRVKLPILLVVS